MMFGIYGIQTTAEWKHRLRRLASRGVARGVVPPGGSPAGDYTKAGAEHVREFSSAEAMVKCGYFRRSMSPDSTKAGTRNGSSERTWTSRSASGWKRHSVQRTSRIGQSGNPSTTGSGYAPRTDVTFMPVNLSLKLVGTTQQQCSTSDGRHSSSG